MNFKKCIFKKKICRWMKPFSLIKSGGSTSWITLNQDTCMPLIATRYKRHAKLGKHDVTQNCCYNWEHLLGKIASSVPEKQHTVTASRHQVEMGPPYCRMCGLGAFQNSWKAVPQYLAGGSVQEPPEASQPSWAPSTGSQVAGVGMAQGSHTALQTWF